MYDMNMEIADSVLTNVYRVRTMLSLGLTAEEAEEILSVQIASAVSTLGKNQMENFFTRTS